LPEAGDFVWLTFILKPPPSRRDRRPALVLTGI